MLIVASERLLIDSVGFTLPAQRKCRADGNFGKALDRCRAAA